MNGQQIANDAWALLGDKGEPHRYAREDMLAWINACTEIIARDAPRARLAAAGTLITVARISALSGTLCFADKWQPAYVHFVCWQALMSRGEATENANNATVHQGLFDKFIS